MTSERGGRLAHRRALQALLTGACVIGAAPILVRLADVGPASAGGWRLLFALPLLAGLGARMPHGIGAPTRLAVLAGVAFALDLGFWHYGIANTSVAKATVLTNLTPVVVTAVTWLVFGRRPTRIFLAAVALAVAGAWILAAARGGGTVGPNPLLGDLLSLATALWYALYFLAMSAARRHDAATRVMFWSTATGVPLLFACAWALGEPMVPASPGGWAAGVALGVVHVAGQGLIAWALGRLPPSTAAVTVLVQPVVAAALGWVVVGERLGLWQFVGAAVALSGVLLAQRSARAVAP
jgi:drug/metabolite transporter (DMT)-like permease